MFNSKEEAYYCPTFQQRHWRRSSRWEWHDKGERQPFLHLNLVTLRYLLQNTKAPSSTDTLLTPQEIFAKKKVLIMQLMEQWSCDIHSLPNKPDICWTPNGQKSHSICYPITQSNINFWVSLIISTFNYYIQFSGSHCNCRLRTLLLTQSQRSLVS